MKPAFAIFSAFETLGRLTKREGTLEGSVPLRVAQACVPLLEGNALGHQITFAKRLTVRARLGRLGIVPSKESEAIARAQRAAVPVLVAKGFLPRGAWAERLARSSWWTERGVLRVWTGLLVIAAEGVWLRVAGPGSRAPIGTSVRTSWIGGGGAVPLVVDFVPRDGALLEGDVANVTAVDPDVRAEVIGPGEDRTGLAERHAAFYDAQYFAAKRSDVTRKYRRVVVRRSDAAGEDRSGAGAVVRVVHLAGPAPDVVSIDRVLGAAEASPVPAPRGQRLDVVRFANAVPFRAAFDGNVLGVTPDEGALARGAEAVSAALEAVHGAAWLRANAGALLYLTKYFTPHPRGEPHFFVKPWALTETPAGWSSIVDGVRGEGFDVMRGVVRTDAFHATPAVFQLQPGKRIRVAQAAPLIDVVPVPRRLLDAGFDEDEVA